MDFVRSIRLGFPHYSYGKTTHKLPTHCTREFWGITTKSTAIIGVAVVVLPHNPMYGDDWCMRHVGLDRFVAEGRAREGYAAWYIS